MREYTFGEVLSFTGASRSQGIHLTAKRIIAPDFGDSAGTGHHRRFSFYNLVEYALAADLARVGVESYAIGIVLRHLRWLIGDAKGLVSWIETVGTLKPKGRRALDPRLIRTELRAHDPFYAWLWSDTESDDAEQIALKETFRERVAAILRRHKTDVWAAFREIRALQRESPYVREGYELWQDVSESLHQAPALLLRRVADRLQLRVDRSQQQALKRWPKPSGNSSWYRRQNDWQNS
jgi:hypothetical protein